MYVFTWYLAASHRFFEYVFRVFQSKYMPVRVHSVRDAVYMHASACAQCTRCRIYALLVFDWTVLCNPITNQLFLQVSRLYSSQVVDIVRHIHRPIGQGHEVSIGLVKVLPLKCPAISNGTKRKGTDMVSIRRRTKGDGYSSMFHAALSGCVFNLREESCKGSRWLRAVCFRVSCI